MSEGLRERWRPITGYEGQYEVSDTGRIKSLKRKGKGTPHTQDLIRKTNYLPKGQELVSLSKNGKVKTLLVHRLVAKAFLPNPNNYPQINHLDGNRKNNNLDNIEWCNQAQNQKHAWDTGLILRENHNTTKLDENKVREIRISFPSKTMLALSREYDVNISTISRIIHRQMWWNVL